MKKEKSPTRFVFIFVFVVFVLAILSLLYKGVLLLNESEFIDNTFNLLLVDENESYLIHIDKSGSKMSSAILPLDLDMIAGKEKISVSAYIGFPLDAIIRAEDVDGGKITLGLVARSFSEKNYVIEGMNQYDLLRIYFASASIPSENKRSIEVDMGVDGSLLIDENQSLLFRDREIFNSGASIGVVNSTGVNGAGGRISQMLTNVGYNVVLTETGQDDETKIIVRSSNGAESTFVSRLAHIFETNNTQIDSNLISEVTIIIGKDYKKIFETDIDP